MYYHLVVVVVIGLSDVYYVYSSGVCFFTARWRLNFDEVEVYAREPDIRAYAHVRM